MADVLQRMVSLSGLATASSALAGAMQRRVAARGLVQEVCRALQLSGPDELQDTLAALLLSECAYKKVEMGDAALAAKLGEMLAQFPAQLVHLDAIQVSRQGIPQNYIVAAGGRAIYVAFMGTKQARDVFADVNALQEAVWSEALQVAEASQVPTAHRGFLARSKSLDLQGLYQLALDSGRRLVLCGHSLGGAVAKLSALRLLRELPEWPPPLLSCVCFATPAVGNSALAELVEAAGWADYFKTYNLPEDQLMRAIRFTQARSAAAALRDSGGEAPAPAAPSAASLVAAAAGSGAGALVRSLGGVASLVALPFTRESAKQTLRRELRAEESTTASLDGATIDDAVAAVNASSPAARPPGPTAAAAPSNAAPATAVPTGAAAAASQGAGASGAGAADPAAAAAAAGAVAAVPPELGPDAGEAGGLVPHNVAVALMLQRRWVAYQLQKAAKAAQGSLTSARAAVPWYHPFGQQLYVEPSGVLAATAAPPAAVVHPDMRALAPNLPGLFSFHRMLAYRTRFLTVVSQVSTALERQGLRVPPPAGAALRPVRLTDVVPPLSVAAAAAWLPLAAPPLDASSAAAPSAPADAPPARGAATAAGGAAFGVRGAAPLVAPSRAARGPLAFLPGGGARTREEAVALLVRVRGHNLHLCRYVGVTAFGDAFLPSDLLRPSSSGGLEQPPQAWPQAWPPPPQQRPGAPSAPPQVRFAALAALSHAVQRARQGAAALARAAEGGRPAWRGPPRATAASELSLRLLLPRSVVLRLISAGDAPQPTTALGASTPTAATAAVAGAGAAPPLGLVLHLRSDFGEVDVVVPLQRYRVAVLGSSVAGAALVGDLLRGALPLPQAPAGALPVGTQAAGAAGAQRAHWLALPQPRRWLGGLQGAGERVLRRPSQPALPAPPVETAATAAATPLLVEQQQQQQQLVAADAAPWQTPGTVLVDAVAAEGMGTPMAIDTDTGSSGGAGTGVGGASLAPGWVEPWIDAPGATRYTSQQQQQQQQQQQPGVWRRMPPNQQLQEQQQVEQALEVEAAPVGAVRGQRGELVVVAPSGRHMQAVAAAAAAVLAAAAHPAQPPRALVRAAAARVSNLSRQFAPLRRPADTASLGASQHSAKRRRTGADQTAAPMSSAAQAAPRAPVAGPRQGTGAQLGADLRAALAPSDADEAPPAGAAGSVGGNPGAGNSGSDGVRGRRHLWPFQWRQQQQQHVLSGGAALGDGGLGPEMGAASAQQPASSPGLDASASSGAGVGVESVGTAAGPGTVATGRGAPGTSTGATGRAARQAGPAAGPAGASAARFAGTAGIGGVSLPDAVQVECLLGPSAGAAGSNDQQAQVERALRLAAVRLQHAPHAAWAAAAWLQPLQQWAAGVARTAAGAAAASVGAAVDAARSRSVQPLRQVLLARAPSPPRSAADAAATAGGRTAPVLPPAAALPAPRQRQQPQGWDVVVLALPGAPQLLSTFLQQPAVAGLVRAAHDAGVPLLPVLLCSDGGRESGGDEEARLAAHALGVPPPRVQRLHLGGLGAEAAGADAWALALLPAEQQRQLRLEVQQLQGAVSSLLQPEGAALPAAPGQMSRL